MKDITLPKSTLSHNTRAFCHTLIARKSSTQSKAPKHGENPRKKDETGRPSPKIEYQPVIALQKLLELALIENSPN